MVTMLSRVIEDFEYRDVVLRMYIVANVTGTNEYRI